MTTRKQKTRNSKRNLPVSSLKGKPLEEGINREKIQKYRELLLNWRDEQAEMLKESPNDILIFAELLGDEDWMIRKYAAKALGYSARIGVDITVSIPALVKALGDEVLEVPINAASALRMAAETGVDITIAIPSLVKALGGRYEYNRELAWWVKKFGDQYKEFRRAAALALERAGKKDYESRVALTEAIMKFVNSDKFMGEAEKNSLYFVETSRALANISNTLKKAESEVQP